MACHCELKSLDLFLPFAEVKVALFHLFPIVLVINMHLLFACIQILYSLHFTITATPLGGFRSKYLALC